MRLSPKSFFFALVVVGLPFAVVTGWALGAPVVHTDLPGAMRGLGGDNAEGGIGPAPLSATHPATTSDGYTARPPRVTAAPNPSPTAPAVSPSIITTTVTVVHSIPPSPAGTTEPPLLTDPPVPTPTWVIDPPIPSATPPAPTTGGPYTSEESGPSFYDFRMGPPWKLGRLHPGGNGFPAEPGRR